jgi:hypothetical protein
MRMKSRVKYQRQETPVYIVIISRFTSLGLGQDQEETTPGTVLFGWFASYSA